MRHAIVRHAKVLRVPIVHVLDTPDDLIGTEHLVDAPALLACTRAEGLIVAGDVATALAAPVLPTLASPPSRRGLRWPAVRVLWGPPTTGRPLVARHTEVLRVAVVRELLAEYLLVRAEHVVDTPRHGTGTSTERLLVAHIAAVRSWAGGGSARATVAFAAAAAVLALPRGRCAGATSVGEPEALRVAVVLVLAATEGLVDGKHLIHTEPGGARTDAEGFVIAARRATATTVPTTAFGRGDGSTPTAALATTTVATTMTM